MSLPRVPWFVAAWLAACNGGSTSDSGSVGNRTPEGKDFCDVRTEYQSRCSSATTRQECLDDVGSFNERVDGRFLTAFERCIGDDCEKFDEVCLAEALIAYDPSNIDADAWRACMTSDADCSDAVRGVLRECQERLGECDGWDDLCTDAIVLQSEYKQQLPGCLALECSAVEPCIDDLIGRPEVEDGSTTPSVDPADAGPGATEPAAGGG